MGVRKLWQLLDDGEVGTEMAVSQCSGQTWAVDLSAWIMHSLTASQKAKTSSDAFMMKTVFSRIQHLLRNGIVPVIVMDGQFAPELKRKTLESRGEKTSKAMGGMKTVGTNRSGLQAMNRRCQGVIESLGLKVIYSPGEAEKTCALLNLQKKVDACLSDDSDIFLYGAQTVYRDFKTQSKQVRKYCMADIQKKLGLSRRDMVLIGLLSGCDYTDGVKGIGPKKVVDLIHCARKYSTDLLARVSGWRNCAELDAMEKRRQELSAQKRPKHCSRCRHPGNKHSHALSGCTVCGSTVDCKEGGNPCTCEYDELEGSVTPYVRELDMRGKALKEDNFPVEELMKEFLVDDETFDLERVEMRAPCWDNLMMGLHLSEDQLVRRMFPVLAFMHLHGTLTWTDADTTPDRILRCSKKDFVPCYEVMWKPFGFGQHKASTSVEMTPVAKQTGDKNPYIVTVPCDLFESKYPQLVQQFVLSVKREKVQEKSPAVENSHSITDFFKPMAAKRRLFDEDAKP